MNAWNDGPSHYYVENGVFCSDVKGAVVNQEDVQEYLGRGYSLLRAISASVSYPDEREDDSEAMLLYGCE